MTEIILLLYGIAFQVGFILGFFIGKNIKNRKTIEEKSKRYDEALIRGSRLWESNMITRENYEYIFPEVEENENKKN